MPPESSKCAIETAGSAGLAPQRDRNLPSIHRQCDAICGRMIPNGRDQFVPVGDEPIVHSGDDLVGPDSGLRRWSARFDLTDHGGFDGVREMELENALERVLEQVESA